MVEYRPASKEELRAIWVRNRADHPNDARWVAWEEDYIRYNEVGAAVTIGAFSEDGILGEVTLLLSPDTSPIGGRLSLADGKSVCNVNALRVHKPYRGLGHGSALVRAAEAHAKSMGFGSATIGAELCERRNIAIYRHLGYKTELFAALEGADEAFRGSKTESFLKNAALLNREFGMVPLMYGSLGLELLCGADFGADDIDILIPEEFLGAKWRAFQSFLEQKGYVLEDLQEHTFQKEGISYSYASLEELQSFADIDISALITYEMGGAYFKLLSPREYLRVYETSEKDGYRVNTRGKKDREKIVFLEDLLKTEGKGAVYPRNFPGDAVLYLRKEL